MLAQTFQALSVDVRELFRTRRVVDDDFINEFLQVLSKEMPPEVVERIIQKVKQLHFGKVVQLDDLIKTANTVFEEM